VRLTGTLPPWVSAKDVILEMLRRHGVGAGVNRVIEYHGPGLAGLSAMDRHVIANMGAELGATTTVFPADDRVREYLAARGRAADYTPLYPDPDARYDVEEEIDLTTLVPLIAKPGSPGNVVPVSDVEGEPVDQVVVGSSANPGLRDFAVVAALLAGRHTHPRVSVDVNPTSRQILADLTAMGGTLDLIRAGARLHQTGCLGCIGMGQAPAAGSNSLRTFPRNFPGRSGTADDRVWLCSPETAVAAALTGTITDPRRLGVDHPSLVFKETSTVDVMEAPLPPEEARTVALEKAPSIGDLPRFDPLPDQLDAPVAIVVGDDVSTDEILPAGAQALPYRSNIPKLAEYAFLRVDPSYVARARETPQHAIVGGRNYGQGSSREHAALALHHLGLRLVIAVSYARIHWQNLANFGVLPLEFTDPADYQAIQPGDRLLVDAALREGDQVDVHNVTRDRVIHTHHSLSPRQVAMVLAGGRIAEYQQNS
jgi:aconitate hydratase